MAEGLERSDWLLMLLADAASERGGQDAVDRVRLQKGLFVVGKGLSLQPPAFYDFQPYYYGPFDREVYDDAQRLADGGLVEVVHGRYLAYRVTAAGRDRAAAITRAGSIREPHLRFIQDVRAWVQRLDFNTLVKAIYQKWPEMRAKSIFQG